MHLPIVMFSIYCLSSSSRSQSTPSTIYFPLLNKLRWLDLDSSSYYSLSSIVLYMNHLLRLLMWPRPFWSLGAIPSPLSSLIFLLPFVPNLSITIPLLIQILQFSFTQVECHQNVFELICPTNGLDSTKAWLTTKSMVSLVPSSRQRAQQLNTRSRLLNKS